MQCAHCIDGEMRLVRFDNRQEVFACRSCQLESLLLDCHLCERRAVRRLPETANGLKRWACYYCQVDKYGCPACGEGWVVPARILGKPGTGYCCEHCQKSWHSTEEITA